MYKIGKQRIPFFAVAGEMWEILGHADEVICVSAGPRELAESAVGRLNAIQPKTWYVWETGGGCSGWRMDLSPEHYILVTSDLSHALEVEDTIEVGLYFTGEGSPADCTPDDYAELQYGKPVYILGGK